MTVSLKINSDLFERSVISKIETHSLSSEVSPEAVKKDDGWYLEITGERSRISHSVFRMNGYDKNDQVLGDAFDFKLYLSLQYLHNSEYWKHPADPGYLRSSPSWYL